MIGETGNGGAADEIPAVVTFVKNGAEKKIDARKSLKAAVTPGRRQNTLSKSGSDKTGTKQ
eukprot:324619-Hanusia_phi.AAC.1